MAKSYTPKTFKKGTVIIKPQGFLDGNNVTLTITPSDMNSFKQKKLNRLRLFFQML